MSICLLSAKTFNLTTVMYALLKNGYAVSVSLKSSVKSNLASQVQKFYKHYEKS